MTFLSHLINGISLGSVYAIIALGYTMVYGIAKMLNFAHGDVIMVGAYISFCTTSYLGLSPLVSVLFSIIVCTVLGIVVERLAYKPLRQAPSLAVLITAIGVSYFLQNAALLIWGSSPKTFSSVTGSWTLKLFGGQLIVSGVTIVTILACILIMICLTLFTNKTKMGTAMRAVSEDKAAAGLMGINVNRVISITFFVGGALAAVSGICYASAYPQVDVYMGSWLGNMSFVAAVLGGIGDIRGAMLGGFILGIAQIFATALNSTFGYAVGFIILIVILLVKPAGIMGKLVIEKV